MTTPPAISLRPCLPGRRLLIVQNPGRGSRNCLEGILLALGKLGVKHCVLEIQEIWNSNKTDPQGLVHRLSRILVEQKIGAVLGYGFNGMSDLPVDVGPTTLRSFFEIRNIPHLMLWIDHPQWHADLAALTPQLQGLFRSANSIHLLKSSAHALEIERILGWPNCHHLDVAIEPEQFPVSPAAEISGGKPEFDLVAICGERGELPDWLLQFVALDDPDPAAIRTVILGEVRAELDKLWKTEIAEGLRAEATAMGRKWSALKAEQPFRAAFRHWPTLIDEFPGICWYLTLAYPTYVKAQRILWRLREWERRFYLAYLARYFRVGVFGGDWSALGLGPGGWVDFRLQSATYARGRVALDIIDGHDEEGLTLKPFEIAASGVPMLHYHAEGLDACFTPGTEIEIFHTPREAREKLSSLLDNAPRRMALAHAARARVLRDHTWEKRIPRMFELARLPIHNFK